MRSHSVVLHIQIIDHLDNDLTQSSTLSAQSQSNPRSYSYQETDGSTHVELIFTSDAVSLIREGAWKTIIDFSLTGLGSFRVISELGEMRGEVKLLNSVIEARNIQLQYQLIMDGSVITHQTLIYTIRGAQA